MLYLPYLTAFKAEIEVVEELVHPKSETVELKVITERIYQTLDDLISPINYLEGYLKLAGNQVPISSSDFGLVQLRKSARSRDVESVLKLSHTSRRKYQQIQNSVDGQRTDRVADR